jgi:hypothetical protein
VLLEEPNALIAHVRVCGSLGWATARGHPVPIFYLKVPEMIKMINSTLFATYRLFDIAKEAYHRASSQAENRSHNDALVAVLFSTATLESYMSQAVFMAETWSHLYPKIEVFAQRRMSL